MIKLLRNKCNGRASSSQINNFASFWFGSFRLEVYGKGTDFEQRQHKTGGTMDMDGGMRGDRSQKRLIPRKGIEGAQKKFGRPYG